MKLPTALVICAAIFCATALIVAHMGEWVFWPAVALAILATT